MTRIITMKSIPMKTLIISSSTNIGKSKFIHNFKKYIFLSAILFSFALFPTVLKGGDKIIVAVAANYIEPFKEIAALYNKKSKIVIEPVFSSSGKIYAQIVNGAPYDIFLSADEKKPDALYKMGLAEKPSLYANGEVVLWSSHKDLCKTGDWKDILKRRDVKRIAIANIETAPYGMASMKAMKAAGLWDATREKLVYSQDIAQSFQYAYTKSVDACFCALSAALSKHGLGGCYLMMKEAPRIVQSACVIKNSKNKAEAEKFRMFLLLPEASNIKKKYGYK